jgi:hypothetical protein
VPDRRTHRGAHPQDARDFAAASQPALRAATTELSWLLQRDYSELAALKLVGDRHQLTARQRQAVSRAACRDDQQRARAARCKQAGALRGAALAIDGFNCLITLEVMLSRGPVFIGRDGATRDLASVHGTYRRVDESAPALELLARALAASQVRHVHVFLDRPVSNSGRVQSMFREAFTQAGLVADYALSERVDQQIVRVGPLVASSDSWVLDHAVSWIDLPAWVAQQNQLSLWSLDMRGPNDAQNSPGV